MSKNDFTLDAKARADVGKGASRRLRRLANEIPAIIYGAGEDPTPVTILHKDIAHAIENEAFFSHIITLKVDGKDVSAVIKDLQRHPAKPRIMHADFMRVSADHEITMSVPLHFIGEDTCKGVKLEGGIINHMITELEIECLPKDLPEYIEVDMSALGVGDSIHISDLVLPAGVTSLELQQGEEHDLPVAACVMPRVEAVEDDAADASEDKADAGSEEDKDDDKADD